MIHSGSRGLGHQVATDALTAMETAMARDKIATNDRQLACARISSQVNVGPVCCALSEAAFYIPHGRMEHGPSRSWLRALPQLDNAN